MSELFVGYARPDRDHVRPIVRALEAMGVGVWWDSELTPGVDFMSEIQSQLDAADHVLVFWSSAGAQSEWLRMEADYAFGAGKLLVARLDDTPLAAPYATIQAADLSSWTGDLDHPGFESLLATLGVLKTKKSRRARKSVPSRGSANRMSDRRSRDVDEEEEVAAWAVTQTIASEQAFGKFLDQHPESPFAEEARRRLTLDEDAREGNIFISYRRNDSPAFARLVYEQLKLETPAERLFFDVESIPPGQIFADYIHQRLLKCSTLVAVLGPGWAGKRKWQSSRIKSKTDLVRIEIETAFDLGLRVVPVTWDLAYIPDPATLPKSLRSICNIQVAAVDLGKSFDADMKRLTNAVSDTVADRAPA